MIFTNDGDYADRLTHPRYRILKHYLVHTSHPLSPMEIEVLSRGIEDEGEMLKPEKIDQLSPGIYMFVLNEGRKREIRRLILRGRSGYAIAAPGRRRRTGTGRPASRPVARTHARRSGIESEAGHVMIKADVAGPIPSLATS